MPTTSELVEERQPVAWLAIVATVAMMGVFAVTLGLTYPLLSLVLERQGVDSAMIGLNAAMAPLGLIVSAPLIPILVGRFGPWLVAMVCTLGAALMLFLLGATQNLWLWFPLRFLLGVSISGLFVVSETWINQLAPTHARGRVMGLYTTVLAAGFACGPFLLAVIGSAGWRPFLIGIAVILSVLPILVAVRNGVPHFGEEERPSLAAFLPLAPALLAIVGVMAFFDAAGLALLPVYGLRHGLDEATTSLAVGVLVIGNVVFQFPVGWLADRWSRRWLLLALALLTVAGCFLLPLVVAGSLWLWPFLFVWGAMAFGVYPIALAELGDRFSGSLLLAGNAAFALMWGVGGMVGAPLAGGAMHLFGPEGLPATLALAYIGLALLALLRRG
ncbi:MAG: MFS transporter [Kiloniellales bacterium]|nr:MFS transporter [Kiloniellales bacterium]